MPGCVFCAIGCAICSAVSFVGNAVSSIVSNPFAIVTAVLAPELLGATAFADATAAVTGDALSAGSILGGDMTGAGMLTAGADTAIGGGTLTGIGGIAADSAGILGGNAITSGLPELGGSNLLSLPSAEQAVSNAQTALQTMSANVTDNSVLSNTVNTVADATNGSTSAIQQAQDMIQNGASSSDAIQATTGATENPISQITNAAKDLSNTAQSISSTANGILNNVSSTIFPNVDPKIANFLTKTLMNTALNGGDVGAALKSTGIGYVGCAVGNAVAANAPTDGTFAPNTLGSAAKGFTTGLLTTGNPTTALESGLISGGGTAIGNTFNSPTFGKIAATGAKVATGVETPTQGLTSGVNSLLGTGSIPAPLNPVNSILNSVFGSSNPNATNRGASSPLSSTNVASVNRTQSNINPAQEMIAANYSPLSVIDPSYQGGLTINPASSAINNNNQLSLNNNNPYNIKGLSSLLLG